MSWRLVIAVVLLSLPGYYTLSRHERNPAQPAAETNSISKEFVPDFTIDKIAEDGNLNPSKASAEKSTIKPTSKSTKGSSRHNGTTTSGPVAQPHQQEDLTKKKDGKVVAMSMTDFYYVAVVAGCSVAGVIGIAVAGVCWYNRSSDEKKRSFHVIPTIIENQGEKTKELSSERRNGWIAKISRKDWRPSKHSRVCSDHFITGKPADLYDTNHPDWAPTLKMGSTLTGKKQPSSSVDRYARVMERENKRVRYSIAESLLELCSPIRVQEPELDGVGKSINQLIIQPVCKFYRYGKLEKQKPDCPPESSQKEVEQLRSDNLTRMIENTELKKKVASREISPESLDGKDEKVKYFTGLPKYASLMALFHFIAPYITVNARNILTKFQMFFITLTKLRLNTPMQDLAYQYGVSVSTVSRIFNSVVNVMHVRMEHFIMWPEREQLRKTMPMEFRSSFGVKVAIIIDCFEVFIERPSNLLARAETWSNYKHSNTVKFLIGISPQGVVSFLSSGWGGRASDKHITENCGLLQKLLPRDVVLADRGFDIAESVGVMCAEVKIPAFTRGKKQLSAWEVESTKKIAHVRIHVERVIGLVRNKYTILKGKLPVDYLISEPDEVPLIDKITIICCALSNLCESVVPFS